MTKILHIETATQICSVALSENNRVIATRSSDEKNAHSRVLTVFIKEILKQNNFKPEDLDALAVSMGPGSYTGLRIGVSTAKGLCFAIDKPLIAIGTLQAMAIGMAEKAGSSDALYCPMIDARRMEVYSAIFDRGNKQVREILAEIIDEDSFSGQLQTNQMIFAGDGAEKCKAILSPDPNAHFLDHFIPSAEFMIKIAYEKFKAGKFEDVAYFEPFYLKDFIAGPPKVKGLR
ncbi:MAG: tRNA (adenosine(37)-N6)-threonylcarbamoyltransferase complex dimerization subunit type 1 TsaB [Bacteroidetes bacterium 4484_276]|nr:MAG: tRNA (adenosine(37)-N6)-threonylcarbamoyltransferase complex dimerization subunit type 1 TsaB [Bacteroidetes bacterium 4484_276]OYT11743.1 MAG: tRNA (adenosine(37)-N6)-threonylcarbamoyltransferase complex dimerization subunit type 1 TsaB [Bacteroidetes bacterium 4572_114]